MALGGVTGRMLAPARPTSILTTFEFTFVKTMRRSPFSRLNRNHAGAVPAQRERLAAALAYERAPRHVGDERLLQIALRTHERIVIDNERELR